MALPAEKHVEHDVADYSGENAARPEELRLLEALLFASSEPLDQAALAKKLPDDVDVKEALAQLQADYSLRGVNLVRIGGKWAFRTANDLAWLMTKETTETRKLSRAAIEVLAIIAYHQPVTRAEIEDIRGVVTSKGTLDVLLETGWIRPRGRRKTPGRPLTFGTTEGFLAQFSLEALTDLPGLDELKGTGLLDPRLPSGFNIPSPSDDPALRDDEDPLEPEDLQLTLAPLVDVEAESAPAETGDLTQIQPQNFAADSETESDSEGESEAETENVAELEIETEAEVDEALSEDDPELDAISASDDEPVDDIADDHGSQDIEPAFDDELADDESTPDVDAASVDGEADSDTEIDPETAGAKDGNH